MRQTLLLWPSAIFSTLLWPRATYGQTSSPGSFSTPFMMPTPAPTTNWDGLWRLLPSETTTWLFEVVAGQQVWQWIAIAFGAVLFWILRGCVRWILRRIIGGLHGMNIANMNIAKWNQKILHLIRPQITSISSWLILYVYLSSLGLSDGAQKHLVLLIKIGIALHIFRALYRLTTFVPELLAAVSQNSALAVEPMLVTLSEKLAKALVAIVVPLVIIQNLGINVASILAGLGLGGLAFALAAKDTAANLFGSLMIMLDRPFKVGDWVIIGDDEGNIEEIGLRTTRIRTFYDSMISVPNSEVINSIVDNMGSRNFRRIKTTLGITYNTPPEKITEFIRTIKKIIYHHPKSQKPGDHHVVLTNFSSSSLDIMLYFFISVKDWTEELKAREEIFLAILTAARQQNISFAYPTRTLHMQDSSVVQRSLGGGHQGEDLKELS